MRNTALSPNVLFNLEHFSHKPLFEGVDYAWEALKRLAAYIAALLREAQPCTQVTVMPGAVVEPNVLFGEGVIVEPHTYVKGPSLIGARTVIRHGAYIRGNAIIGEDCIIGNATEVKHAVLMDGVRASHWNYIGDSIVGFGVNIGAGAKLSNRKITDTEIVVKDAEGNRYPTGLTKLGGIIGDETQIGCNAVLNPGTVLGKRCLVYPLTSVRGVHAPGQVIKP